MQISFLPTLQLYVVCEGYSYNRAVPALLRWGSWSVELIFH